MLRDNPLLDYSNHRLQRLELCRQDDQAGTRVHRQAFILFVGNDRQQLLEPFVPLRRHNTKFGHMRPQGIDHLGPLPDQQIARAMLHQLTLLIGRFDSHKSHARAANRLADRRGICRVVLVAPDISLHVLRRHQTDRVTELRQLTRPVVRAGTGLHADQAWRQCLEELQHLTAAKLLPDDDLLSRVDAVDLEHVLGEI
jgi:hypothetical protein